MFPKMQNRTGFPAVIVVVLLLAGCATRKHTPITKLPTPAPKLEDIISITPPGIAPSLVVGAQRTEAAEAPLVAFVLPPDVLAVTNILRQGTNVILRWQGGGTNLNQVEYQTNLSGAWQSLGSPTTNNASTNGVIAARAFFRLVRVNPSQSPGTLQWVKSITSGGAGVQAVSKAIAADRAGNLVSVGVWQGTADLGAGPVVSANNTYDAFIVKYNSAGGVSWEKHFGNSGYDEQINAVAVDSQTNLVVVGSFKGTVDFTGNGTGVQGTTKLTATQNSGFDTYDAYVAKYNSAGVLQWVRNYGGIYQDLGSSVAVDANDRIFITVNFQSPVVSFGEHAVNSTGGAQSIALARLSAAGVAEWAIARGGSGSSSVNGVAVDKNNDVVITGSFTSSANFGGGIRSAATSYSSIFIAKYLGAGGTYVWDVTVGNTTGSCGGFGITTHPTSGNVIVTGSHKGTVNFGVGAVSTPYQAAFLAAYSSAGVCLWNNYYGGDSASSGDAGASVTVDAAGNLVFSGHADTSVYFGGPATLFANGFFIAAFTLSGNNPPVYEWARISTGGGTASGVTVAAPGHVFMGGSFQNTTDFGGISKTVPSGSVGAFAVEYIGQSEPPLPPIP